MIDVDVLLKQQTVPRPAEGAVDLAVTVDIYDQTYHLRGQDTAYIESLAAMVDSKMRAVSSGGTTVDSLRVAVLAALNIADQLARLEARYCVLSGNLVESENTVRDRAASLAGLLDSALENAAYADRSA